VNFAHDMVKGLFILVLLSMGILLASIAVVGTSGMESLILILPWYLMVLVHAMAGSASVILALIQKRRGVASAIFVYLMIVAGVNLHWFGVTEEVAELAELEYLEQLHPADRELVRLVEQREADPKRVARLVQAGADVNRLRPDGDTALLRAAGTDTTLTAALLAAGADPNLKSHSGSSPFHRAVVSRQFDAAKLLADAGADPNLADASGTTAFCALLARMAPNDVEPAHRPLVERLVTPTTVVTGDCPALETALRQQRFEVAKMILAAGHTLTTEEARDNESTLGAAIKANDETWIDLCLSAGIIATPHLRRAVEQNQAALVEKLLSRGADANGGFHLQFSAMKPERDGVTELLLEHGADPARADDKGRNALAAALRGSHVDNIRRFAALGLDVNGDYRGEPLVHAFYTLEERKKYLPGLLLELGADPNSKNDQGTSLIVVALKNAHQELVKQAIEHGADLYALDNDGWTVVHHAAKTRWEGTDSMRVLVDAGVDINVLSAAGETPLCIAMRSHNKPMVAYLEQINAKQGHCEIKPRTGVPVDVITGTR
jgi:ankyrin repeat protein